MLGGMLAREKLILKSQVFKTRAPLKKSHGLKIKSKCSRTLSRVVQVPQQKKRTTLQARSRNELLVLRRRKHQQRSLAGIATNSTSQTI